jgi:hypothetical protein
MLDPITAIGVAGNIVQFVDFAIKLLSKSKEIYQSADGASVEYRSLEAIAANLSRMTDRLRKDLCQHLIPPMNDETFDSYRSDKRTEIELGLINAKCAREADALLAILRDLKVDGKHKKW